MLLVCCLMGVGQSSQSVATLQHLVAMMLNTHITLLFITWQQLVSPAHVLSQPTVIHPAQQPPPQPPPQQAAPPQHAPQQAVSIKKPTVIPHQQRWNEMKYSLFSPWKVDFTTEKSQQSVVIFDCMTYYSFGVGRDPF